MWWGSLRNVCSKCFPCVTIELRRKGFHEARSISNVDHKISCLANIDLWIFTALLFASPVNSHTRNSRATIARNRFQLMFGEIASHGKWKTYSSWFLKMLKACGDCKLSDTIESQWQQVTPFLSGINFSSCLKKWFSTATIYPCPSWKPVTVKNWRTILMASVRKSKFLGRILFYDSSWESPSCISMGLRLGTYMDSI